MTIVRYAERHPLLTAYVAHRFVMAKYHPELNAARKARKAQNAGAGWGLMIVVFVVVPAVAIFLFYVLACLAWYGLRFWTHKLLRRSTANPNLVVPGYFPKKVVPAVPTPEEQRAAGQHQARLDGLARHEAARQARIATVMASLEKPDPASPGSPTSGTGDDPPEP